MAQKLDVVAKVEEKVSAKTGNSYGILYITFPNGYEAQFMLSNEQRFILSQYAK